MLSSLGEGLRVSDLLGANPDLMWDQQWVISPFFRVSVSSRKNDLSFFHIFIWKMLRLGYISVFSPGKSRNWQSAAPWVDPRGRCGDTEGSRSLGQVKGSPPAPLASQRPGSAGGGLLRRGLHWAALTWQQSLPNCFSYKQHPSPSLWKV